jgi:hypothetical protein
VLTISGERKRDLDDDVSFFVHERFYGVFRRNITLPAGISEDDISADFDYGLVEITVRDGAVGAGAQANRDTQQNHLNPELSRSDLHRANAHASRCSYAGCLYRRTKNTVYS